MKSFTDLKQLSQQLQQQEKERAEREAKQRAEATQRKAEANLFRHAIGEVQPIKQSQRQHFSPVAPQPVPYQSLADEQAALASSLSDEFDPASLLDTDESLSYLREGLGQDVLRKLRRGHWVIQGQLDLHGFRREEAREKLATFLHDCKRSGKRCVRIVHGKGLGSVNKEPVLKHKVKNWLIQKEEVLAFCQATPAEGGAGALLVLLQAA